MDLPREWDFLRKKVLRRDSFTCRICKKTTGKFEIDHIVPRHRGGGHGLGNLQTLCRDCHFSKSKKETNFRTKTATQLKWLAAVDELLT